MLTFQPLRKSNAAEGTSPRTARASALSGGESKKQWIGSRRYLAAAVAFSVSFSIAISTALAQETGLPGTPVAPRIEEGVNYPRLANMYLHGSVSPEDIPSLARWDLLILDSVWTNAQLRQLRDLNPDIKIFFYICPYCVTVSPPPPDEWRRVNLDYLRTNDLWWRNVNGTVASDWQGVQLANITDKASSGPWGSYRRWLGLRVQQLVRERVDLDGVFYDNYWKEIGWEQGPIIQVDSDCNPTHNPSGCDGAMDTPEELDRLWNGALRAFARDTRKRFDDVEQQRGTRPLAILGNGSSDYFPFLKRRALRACALVIATRSGKRTVQLNHEMFEGSSGYLVAPFSRRPYSAQILNAVWNGTWDFPRRDWEFERHKRFTFVSALLGDGYYSLDAVDQGHGSLWWEPEYDGGGLGKGYLGAAMGPMHLVGSTSGTENVSNGA